MQRSLVLFTGQLGVSLVVLYRFWVYHERIKYFLLLEICQNTQNNVKSHMLDSREGDCKNKCKSSILCINLRWLHLFLSQQNLCEYEFKSIVLRKSIIKNMWKVCTQLSGWINIEIRQMKSSLLMEYQEATFAFFFSFSFSFLSLSQNNDKSRIYKCMGCHMVLFFFFFFFFFFVCFVWMRERILWDEVYSSAYDQVLVNFQEYQHVNVWSFFAESGTQII